MKAMAGTWGAHPGEHARAQVIKSRRWNIGCGQFPLLFWTNVDESSEVIADLYHHVPPIPLGDGALDEVYAGHFLEHLTPEEADVFVDECFRVLVPGGRLGIVVPDLREIVTRYLAGTPDLVEHPMGTFYRVSDLDDVCRMFIYSTVQRSHHQWCYDRRTLTRLIERHGFKVTGEIVSNDARIPVPAWYQVGVDAVRP